MRTILFITDRERADLTPDDRIAAAALERRGVRVHPAVWSDHDVDWGMCDLAVFRSTWDYTFHISAFEHWLNRLADARIPVINPIPTVQWNLNKRYLLELERRGAPIVPTALLTPRDGDRHAASAADRLAAVCDERGWAQVVVKPPISAGARGTHRFDRRDPPHEALELMAANEVLVQPYVPQIESVGEWSLFYFVGAFSHAVIKKPAAGDFRVQSYHGGEWAPAVADAALRASAERALSAADRPWTYARVDGVVVDGVFLLMELELIEPSLWFEADPNAADRFADALLGVLR